jgi:RNA polymerase sigma factor (sigma-70 family)
MDDWDLLRQWAERASDDAFRSLVERHVDLVYSVARRSVPTAHQAQEVTQTVFIILARKAARLSRDTVLAGWLYRTTRYAAAQMFRAESRRHHYQTLAIMDPTPSDHLWDRIAPHFEVAIDQLSEADRDAIILRFMEDRSLREVGHTLGLSEDAARKRVERALDKLRLLFARRGVTTSSALLGVVLMAQSIHAAPVGLVANVTAGVVTPGVALTTPALVKETMAFMAWTKTKIVAFAGVALLLCGVTTILVSQKAAPVVAATPQATLPIKFANHDFSPQGDDRFFIGIDPNTKRTPNSAPAGYINSLIAPAPRGSPDYLRLRAQRVAHLEVTKDSPLFGKRIRLTGWLKTSEVDNGTSLGVMIRNPAGRIIAMDEMMDRPVRGSTDWKQYEMVADVPEESCSIDFGVPLYGTGAVWTDDFQINVVSSDTPITDDRRWHKWSPNAADYAVTTDLDNQRDGHPTLCLAYTPEGRAPRGSWMWWGQCIREPQKYAGHTVRMTVWIKCEDASGNAGINLRPKGPDFQLLNEDEKPRRHIKGTTDWIERSIFCAIPEETQCLDTGFYFNGSGKLWIDMESLRYEIVDQPAAPVRGMVDFTSNIPVIVLRGQRPGPVSGSKTYSAFQMEIYEPEKSAPACLCSAPTVTIRVGVRLRGMVSRLFPKLSYRLELQDEAGRSQGRSLLGMPGDADWVLQGPWLDKSLIRNALSYDLARAMGCAAMRTRPCEVFLNTSGQPLTEADYLGVYQLTEHIERGEDRVNVTKLTPEENSEPSITGGYILAWDVGDGDYLPNWKSIQVRYPPEPSLAQKKWIDSALTRFDQALKSRGFRDPVNGYAAHIEVEAWVNYIIFEELIFNLDGYVRSFYLQKDRGGKIRPGPVWDHDLAMGHQFPQGTPFTDWWYLRRNAPHGWIPRLIADPDFSRRMAQRWTALRRGVLSDTQIDARIRSIAEPLLSGAADRNFQRWKVLNVERPFPKPDDYITIASATYPEQIDALRKFFRRRAAWMDEHLRK